MAEELKIYINRGLSLILKGSDIYKRFVARRMFYESYELCKP